MDWIINTIVGVMWLLTLLSWFWALLRVHAAPAGRGELGRELVIRLGMVVLVGWALMAPHGAILPLADHFTAILLTGLILGHLLSIVARYQLSTSWGIGIRPRSGTGTAIHTGVYRWLSHPIYLGIGLALCAQAILQQNLPSVLLAISGIIVITLKARREQSLLRTAPPKGDG